jgi:Na+/proline symporter
MSERNEILGIFLGILLLLGMHIIAIIAIFFLGFIIEKIYGGYSVISVWIVGSYGFLFWQLLYVIPVCLMLKRQQRPGMMKGVIIGAVITALLNGTCSLLILSQLR